MPEFLMEGDFFSSFLKDSFSLSESFLYFIPMEEQKTSIYLSMLFPEEIII